MSHTDYTPQNYLFTSKEQQPAPVSPPCSWLSNWSPLLPPQNSGIPTAPEPHARMEQLAHMSPSCRRARTAPGSPPSHSHTYPHNSRKCPPYSDNPQSPLLRPDSSGSPPLPHRSSGSLSCRLAQDCPKAPIPSLQVSLHPCPKGLPERAPNSLTYSQRVAASPYPAQKLA